MVCSMSFLRAHLYLVAMSHEKIPLTGFLSDTVFSDIAIAVLSFELELELEKAMFSLIKITGLSDCG